MSETTVAARQTREEQEAALDALLSERVVERNAEVLTLEQLLGHPVSLGDAWPGAFYLSPKMKDLKAIWQAMEAIEDSVIETIEDGIRVMDQYAALAQRLVLLPDGEGYRRPTLDEVQERYELMEVKDLVNRILRKDGFYSESAPEGNA